MSKHTAPALICLCDTCGGVVNTQVAQAVLVPLLVDKEKVGPSALRAIKAMMVMQPPPSFKVRHQPVRGFGFSFLERIYQTLLASRLDYARLLDPKTWTWLHHMLHCASYSSVGVTISHQMFWSDCFCTVLTFSRLQTLM